MSEFTWGIIATLTAETIFVCVCVVVFIVVERPEKGRDHEA